MKKALVTGITGQDGSYLAELLLSKGYDAEELAKTVLDPSLREQLGRRGRSYAEQNHSKTMVVASYDRLLREICAG